MVSVLAEYKEFFLLLFFLNLFIAFFGFFKRSCGDCPTVFCFMLLFLTDPSRGTFFD